LRANADGAPGFADRKEEKSAALSAGVALVPLCDGQTPLNVSTAFSG
jgi:hypothetical protein